jgi:hypothetical protein
MESNERNGARTAARLTQLRQRVERLRQRRTKRSPMPAELWTAATELARELGAYRVARDLGVGYGSLRSGWVAGANGAGAQDMRLSRSLALRSWVGRRPS